MEGNKKQIQFKRVFSVLYDIRPVTAAGDLDVERIKKISAVLNLRDTNEIAASRTPRNDRKEEEPFNFVLTKTDDLDVLPSREEILAELDKIENFEEFLKNTAVEEKKNKEKEKKIQVDILKKQIEEVDEAPEEKKEFEQMSGMEEFYFPEAARETILAAESDIEIARGMNSGSEVVMTGRERTRLPRPPCPLSSEAGRGLLAMTKRTRNDGGNEIAALRSQ